MNEVRYSVNGKYFKDFGIYISESDGLFDALKRKSVNTYDWAEYHGSAPDLSSPKFEAREISLVGFVVGENWEVMKSNFDAIISEFQKAGTQRLLIEPFGLKALPYEVYMDDSISLKKTFKNGKMVGVFTLKLIEPNPIKKVLYFTGDALNLAYNSPNETEIFYGNGLKETAKGNVSLSNKTLVNRVVSGYGFEGRNYYKKSSPIFLLLGASNLVRTETGFNVSGTASNDAMIRIKNVVTENGWWTVSFEHQIDYAGYALTIDICDRSGITFPPNTDVNWKKFTHSVNVDNYGDGSSYNFIDITGLTDQVHRFRNFKIEKGNKASDYTPSPEDEKIIIIAGNVEEITGLTTNADVLWEKL